MSEIFFQELGLPEAYVNLRVGSGSHTQQTSEIMSRFEPIVLERKPDLILVYGDVNSTLGAALVCAKVGIPVGHVEAGLRSFDRTMPEEINRILTDHISDFLFTTEPSANANLEREAIDSKRVHYVGNCMVDTLFKHLEFAQKEAPWEGFGVKEKSYSLLTLHRPSNVDMPEKLEALIGVINRFAECGPMLFPVHPRTRTGLKAKQAHLSQNVMICDPLPYKTFLGLMANAMFVATDSGGIQEETTVLNIPCITLRENTERPITIEKGSNYLVGSDLIKIKIALNDMFERKYPL
jgi:UDP-N-acetylglucosamine 2-epimerase (non-hydrolysing)